MINNVKAKKVTADRVILGDGREIMVENVIWTAGSRASVKLDEIDLPHDEHGGLTVDRSMRVVGHTDNGGVGDCAAVLDEDGSPVPPNAQAAVQEAGAVARNILAVIDGEDPKPFRYKSLGQLVELGSEFAVNDVLGVKFRRPVSGHLRRLIYLFS